MNPVNIKRVFEDETLFLGWGEKSEIKRLEYDFTRGELQLVYLDHMGIYQYLYAESEVELLNQIGKLKSAEMIELEYMAEQMAKLGESTKDMGSDMAKAWHKELLARAEYTGHLLSDMRTLKAVTDAL